jgi:hypothetical protein
MDERQSKGTETYAEAASRLLRRLDESAKRRAGQTPAEIQKPDCVRLVPANDDRKAAGNEPGEEPEQSPPQPVSSREGARQERGADGVSFETWLGKPKVRPSATCADSNLDMFTGTSIEELGTARRGKE